MGSSFYTFEEAAARLGCSKRTIHNHVKRGYLTKSVQNGRVVLRKEEVEQLATSTGTDLPAMNRQSFFMLQTRMRRLEELVAVLQRALDIRDSPMRPSQEDALRLHTSIVYALTKKNWTDEEIDKWSSIYDRIDEVTLDILSEALTSTIVYEPILRLCLAQMRSVTARPEFGSSLELQILHKKLDTGRKNLRDVTLTWLTLKQGTLPNTVVERFETDKESLFQRLSQKTKEKIPKGLG